MSKTTKDNTNANDHDPMTIQTRRKQDREPQYRYIIEDEDGAMTMTDWQYLQDMYDDAEWDDDERRSS